MNLVKNSQEQVPATVQEQRTHRLDARAESRTGIAHEERTSELRSRHPQHALSTRVETRRKSNQNSLQERQRKHNRDRTAIHTTQNQERARAPRIWVCERIRSDCSIHGEQKQNSRNLQVQRGQDFDGNRGRTGKRD
jgi:hypothetical protein